MPDDLSPATRKVLATLLPRIMVDTEDGTVSETPGYHGGEDDLVGRTPKLTPDMLHAIYRYLSRPGDVGEETRL